MGQRKLENEDSQEKGKDALASVKPETGTLTGSSIIQPEIVPAPLPGFVPDGPGSSTIDRSSSQAGIGSVVLDSQKEAKKEPQGQSPVHGIEPSWAKPYKPQMVETAKDGVVLKPIEIKDDGMPVRGDPSKPCEAGELRDLQLIHKPDPEQIWRQKELERLQQETKIREQEQLMHSSAASRGETVKPETQAKIDPAANKNVTEAGELKPLELLVKPEVPNQNQDQKTTQEQKEQPPGTQTHNLLPGQHEGPGSKKLEGQTPVAEKLGAEKTGLDGDPGKNSPAIKGGGENQDNTSVSAADSGKAKRSDTASTGTSSSDGNNSTGTTGTGRRNFAEEKPVLPGEPPRPLSVIYDEAKARLQSLPKEQKSAEILKAEKSQATETATSKLQAALDLSGKQVLLSAQIKFQLQQTEFARQEVLRFGLSTSLGEPLAKQLLRIHLQEIQAQKSTGQDTAVKSTLLATGQMQNADKLGGERATSHLILAANKEQPLILGIKPGQPGQLVDLRPLGLDPVRPGIFVLSDAKAAGRALSPAYEQNLPGARPNIGPIVPLAFSQAGKAISSEASVTNVVTGAGVKAGSIQVDGRATAVPGLAAIHSAAQAAGLRNLDSAASAQTAGLRNADGSLAAYINIASTDALVLRAISQGKMLGPLGHRSPEERGMPGVEILMGALISGLAVARARRFNTDPTEYEEKVRRPWLTQLLVNQLLKQKQLGAGKEIPLDLSREEMEQLTLDEREALTQDPIMLALKMFQESLHIDKEELQKEAQELVKSEFGVNNPALLKQAAYVQREKHVVKKDDSLEKIAEDLFEDRQAAALIADLNLGRTKESSLDQKRVVELYVGQSLDLPNKAEVESFLKKLAKAGSPPPKVVTLISCSSENAEVIRDILGKIF